MPPAPPTARTTPPSRWIAVVAALIVGGAPGCGRERRMITPTTTGTDLTTMPRGRMTPLPFPGSSLARAGSPAPPGDPETVPASAVAPRP